ncbi:hypothetical protein CsSME_00018102 [Camellia sinensis var. sinensis]
MPDKLGMRCPGRPTIRPALRHDQIDHAFEVGAPVDAWWSDGWWEGVVTGIGNSGDESLPVYIPSENILLSINRKNLRVSRDWMGDHWVDIKLNHDVLSAISSVIRLDAKLSPASISAKDPESDDYPMSCHEVPPTTKLDIVEEEKLDFDNLAPDDELSRGMEIDNNHTHVNNSPEKDEAENGHHISDNVEDYDDDNDDVGYGDDNKGKLEEFEPTGKKCESEFLEVVA